MLRFTPTVRALASSLSEIARLATRQIRFKEEKKKKRMEERKSFGINVAFHLPSAGATFFSAQLSRIRVIRRVVWRD